MEYRVYMVRRINDGQFWKKGSSTQGLNNFRTPVDWLFTPVPGRARIFESEKIARNTLVSWKSSDNSSLETWETLGLVEIIPVRMIIL
jgi:hypothetical protein